MIKINLVTLRSLRRSLALLLLLSPGTLATAEDSVGQWAQWRGPNRDGISTEKGLLKSWPDQGPNLDYRVKGLGGGMSSVAIADGKILTMGGKDGSTQLICLGQQDGQILWSTAFTPNKQDPTCSPTIDGASNLV